MQHLNNNINRSETLLSQQLFCYNYFVNNNKITHWVYRRSINVVTINLFFDDTLKGHDRAGAEKDSIFPDWLRPSKGAGYIMGLNFNYGAEEGLVEYYSTDLYIGKRYFILPRSLLYKKYWFPITKKNRQADYNIKRTQDN